MRPLHDADDETRARVVAGLSTGLASEPEVAFAYLYGSFAERRAFRDIDIGVYLAEGSEPEADADLAIADRLSRRVMFPIDVRVLNRAPVTFLFHVFQGTLLVCRDEPLLAGVLESTAHRYFDLEPLLRRATREAFAS